MDSIDHLPEAEKKHYILCNICGKYADMRDLSDVFYHDTGDCITEVPKRDLPFSSARRIGDPEEFINDKNKTTVDLN